MYLIIVIWKFERASDPFGGREGSDGNVASLCARLFVRYCGFNRTLVHVMSSSCAVGYVRETTPSYGTRKYLTPPVALAEAKQNPNDTQQMER